MNSLTFTRHSWRFATPLLVLAFASPFACAQPAAGEAMPVSGMLVREACPDVDQALPDALWRAWHELGAPAVVVVEFSVKGRSVYDVTPLSGPRRYFHSVRQAVRSLECNGRDEQVHRMRLIIRFVRDDGKEVAFVEADPEVVALR